MPDDNKAPVIVIRKRRGHESHHGGAWKVAYADFVTAMMAFFLVMWLMNSSEKVQKAIGAYFRDPTGVGKQSGSTMSGRGDGLQVNKNNLNRLKDQLDQAMKKMPQFESMKDHVSMMVTGEGLRVELLETEKGLFFESGKMHPSDQGREMLLMMAKELGQLSNNILIEGHTDAKPFHSTDGYTNWELSVDRANAARKLMETSGLWEGQITQIRGFADRRLRVPQDPDYPSNRRISVIVQYLDQSPGEAPAVRTKAADNRSLGHR